MVEEVLKDVWIIGTRLNLKPGPTKFHGLSLYDYHPLETTRCFAATISIFLLHWTLYRRCVHNLASKPVRCVLASTLAVSYLLAVLYLHPWQPYWIRELSVMLVQLFSWKVADLAVLRHGEPLPCGFWSWILFDVLVLRPPALALPGQSKSVAWAPQRNTCPHALGQPFTNGSSGTVAEVMKLGTEVSAGYHTSTVPEQASGSTIPASSTESNLSLSWGCSRASSTCSTVSNTSSRSRSRGGRSGDTSTGRQRAPVRNDRSGCCGRHAGTDQKGGRLSPRLLAGAGVAAARLRLAGAALWGPLLDFLWTYNACEAVNAYLMHRHVDDILSAPFVLQVWLSMCFAAALYFHLRYFFYSMEMLWMAGFALAGGVKADRWAPLFNSPERSSSPVDFWNRRWHQAFRWWWIRLVFVPVRVWLRAALERMAPDLDDLGQDTSAGAAPGSLLPCVDRKDGDNYDDGAPHTLMRAGGPPDRTVGHGGDGQQVTKRPGVLNANRDGQLRPAARGKGSGTEAGSHWNRRHCGGGFQHWALWRWLGLGPGLGALGCDRASTGSGRKGHQKKKKNRRRKHGKRAGAGGGKTGGSGGSQSGLCARSPGPLGGNQHSVAAVSRRAGAEPRNCSSSWHCSRTEGWGLQNGGRTCGEGRYATRRRKDGGGALSRWLQRHRRTLLVAVPTVAVFMFSALFHETLLWINFGRPTGEQTAFFMLHALLVLVQRGLEQAAPKFTSRLRAGFPAPLRVAAFMCLTAISSVLFFRPWFRSSYHRELRVLVYGPAGWVVRVWVLGIPRAQVRLLW